MSSTGTKEQRDHKKVIDSNPHVKQYLNRLREFKNSSSPSAVVKANLGNNNEEVASPSPVQENSSGTGAITPQAPIVDNTAESIRYKEKGNQMFAQQKYKESVEYYSMAIKLDSTNSVLYANRAIAYIKMKNFTQAEVDCNRCLNLDPTNIKAYHRRGTARLELKKYDDAISDFKHILLLDPQNKDSMTEMNRAIKLKSTEPPQPQQEQAKVEPKKESMVPLTIKKPNELQIPQQSSSQSKKPNIIQIEAIHSTSSPTTATTPSPTTTPSISTASTSTSTPVATASGKGKMSSLEERLARISQMKAPVPKVAPKNSFEFERVYLSFQGDDSLFYQYFKLIQPSQFNRIIDEALTPQLLSSILSILSKHYIPNKEYQLAYDILSSLLRVSRMSVNLLSLSSEEKKLIKSLVNSLSSTPTDTAVSFTATDLTTLLQKYNV